MRRHGQSYYRTTFTTTELRSQCLYRDRYSLNPVDKLGSLPFSVSLILAG
jgi:hypothetical protein